MILCIIVWTVSSIKEHIISLVENWMKIRRKSLSVDGLSILLTSRELWPPDVSWSFRTATAAHVCAKYRKPSGVGARVLADYAKESNVYLRVYTAGDWSEAKNDWLVPLWMPGFTLLPLLSGDLFSPRVTRLFIFDVGLYIPIYIYVYTICALVFLKLYSIFWAFIHAFAIIIISQAAILSICLAYNSIT